MSKISRVKARQVFDSRGNPTIEAEISSGNFTATAIAHLGLQLVPTKLLKKEINQIKDI